MEIAANKISSSIIDAHMNKRDFSIQNIQITNSLEYGLYDKKGEPLYSQIEDKVDFSRQTFKFKEALFYISKAPAGHLGVYFVVIKENTLHEDLHNLHRSITLSVSIVYFLIALIGLVLTKLFMYPIQSQREKLNNFVKDTTHELNTPLSALMLCVDSKDFDSKENKERIKISAKKISNLYKDLTYSLLENHEISNAKEIDISKILQNELVYFNQIAQKKNIAITTDIEKTLYKIDVEDFIRLINNLISNAIKYSTRKGQVKITLKDKILSIEDNGIGIAKDKLSEIFKRYFRATSSVGGFGIGLNIVSAICKNYNIAIDVKSELHKGTIFTLHFS